MGNPWAWLVFIAVAGSALLLIVAAIVVFVLVLTVQARGRVWTLGIAALGAGAVIAATFVLAVEASVGGQGWMPAGTNPSQIVVFGVPLTAACFVAGAGLGFLTRGRSRRDERADD